MPACDIGAGGRLQIQEVRGQPSMCSVSNQQAYSLLYKKNIHYKKEEEIRLNNRFFCMSPFQLATMMLPEEENFLLLFRRETPLDNSVEFMRVRVKGQQIMER